MLRHKRKLFAIFFLCTSTAFSAVNEESRLLEELTGKKKTTSKELQNPSVGRARTPAQVILDQGHAAFRQKQYRQALEHYDRVITQYANTREALQAYKSKSELYTEMGLENPAQLNRQLADQVRQKLTR